MLIEAFHKLVLASKLPIPSKFVVQSISFSKAFCKLFLDHEINKFDLFTFFTRSSAFDLAVIIDGPGGLHVTAIEKLSSDFVFVRLISSSDNATIPCQYTSLPLSCVLFPFQNIMIGSTLKHPIIRSRVDLNNLN